MFDNAPRVGVIMGSDSDWPVMEAAAVALAEFGVPFEVGVVSARRCGGWLARQIEIGVERELFLA